MIPLPQELVDKIIDELSCSHPGDSDCCAPYSLISRVWVEHAQEYHFSYVNIYGMDELEKWRRCITPDPFGVSRHTRDLCLGQIKTIEGYEAHLHAFNRVEFLSISYCGFLLSPSVVECFAQMGSSLVQLSFDSRTTARTIATLLAMLPLLEIFAIDTEVEDDACEIELACSIPFFKNSNSFQLLGHPPETLNWVPPNPQLGELTINMRFFLNEAARLNQWISASFETLTSLDIDAFPESGKCRFLRAQAWVTTLLTPWPFSSHRSQSIYPTGPFPMPLACESNNPGVAQQTRDSCRYHPSYHQFVSTWLCSVEFRRRPQLPPSG